MNEIDPCLSRPLCVLYGIQNQIFLHWHHPAVSRLKTSTAVQLSAATTIAVPMRKLLYSCSSRLKFQTFFFGLKTKDPLKKSLTLPKIFPYFLIFPSTNSSLVTYLALYKDDQIMHITHYYPSLSHSLILKLHHFAAHKHISISFSISLTKSLSLESNITRDITQKITPVAIISSCIYYI